MIDMVKWIERRFAEKPEAGTFPMVLERLAGTPARVEEKLAAAPADLHARRAGDAWSIQEHVGHLWVVEGLWDKRLGEFLAGAPELTAADMSNRKTHDSDFNAMAAGELARSFREARTKLVTRLEAIEPAAVERESLHPRLRRPMRLIDLCAFIAEHDDHHLALMSRSWRELAGVADVLARPGRPG